MAAKAVNKKGKYRIVDSAGRVVKNELNQPIDGGGYETGTAAEKHARKHNMSKG